MTRAVAGEFGDRVQLVVHTGPQSPESARAYGVMTAATLVVAGMTRVDRITPGTVRQAIERALADGA